MKERYEAPEMDVIGFENEDIITTSGVIIDPNPDVGDTGTDFEDFFN